MQPHLAPVPPMAGDVETPESVEGCFCPHQCASGTRVWDSRPKGRARQPACVGAHWWRCWRVLQVLALPVRVQIQPCGLVAGLLPQHKVLGWEMQLPPL